MIEGSYDFLHDITCQTRRGVLRTTNVMNFWMALQRYFIIFNIYWFSLALFYVQIFFSSRGSKSINTLFWIIEFNIFLCSYYRDDFFHFLAEFCLLESRFTVTIFFTVDLFPILPISFFFYDLIKSSVLLYELFLVLGYCWDQNFCQFS